MKKPRDMKPQRSQRKIISIKDDYPYRDITGKIISCVLDDISD